jgi:hypothetical protein
MSFKPLSSGQITSFHSTPTRGPIANDKQALLEGLTLDRGYQSFIENLWLSNGENPQFLRYNDSNTPAVKIFLEKSQNVHGIQFQAGENTIDHNQLAQIFGQNSAAYQLICKLCQFGSLSRLATEEENPTAPTTQIPPYRFQATDQTQFLNALDRTNARHENTIADIMARHSTETLAFIGCIQAMHAQPAHTLSLPAQFAQESGHQQNHLIRPITAIESQIGQLQHSIDTLTQQLAAASSSPQLPRSPQPIQPPAPNALSPTALNVITGLYERIIQQGQENAALQIQLLNAQHQLQLATLPRGNSENGDSPRSFGRRSVVLSPQRSDIATQTDSSQEIGFQDSNAIHQQDEYSFESEEDNHENSDAPQLFNDQSKPPFEEETGNSKPKSPAGSIPQGSNIENSGNEDESLTNLLANIRRLQHELLDSQSQSENSALKGSIVNLTINQEKLEEIISNQDPQNQPQHLEESYLSPVGVGSEDDLIDNQNQLSDEVGLLEERNILYYELQRLKSELEYYKSMEKEVNRQEDLQDQRNPNYDPSSSSPSPTINPSTHDSNSYSPTLSTITHEIPLSENFEDQPNLDSQTPSNLSNTIDTPSGTPDDFSTPFDGSSSPLANQFYQQSPAQNDNQDSQISRLDSRIDELHSQIRYLQEELRLKEKQFFANQPQDLEESYPSPVVVGSNEDLSGNQNPLLHDGDSVATINYLLYQRNTLSTELDHYKKALAEKQSIPDEWENQRASNDNASSPSPSLTINPSTHDSNSYSPTLSTIPFKDQPNPDGPLVFSRQNPVPFSPTSRSAQQTPSNLSNTSPAATYSTSSNFFPKPSFGSPSPLSDRPPPQSFTQNSPRSTSPVSPSPTSPSSPEVTSYQSNTIHTPSPTPDYFSTPNEFYQQSPAQNDSSSTSSPASLPIWASEPQAQSDLNNTTPNSTRSTNPYAISQPSSPIDTPDCRNESDHSEAQEDNTSSAQFHPRTTSPEMSMYNQYKQLEEDRKSQQARLAELKGVLDHLLHSTSTSIARAVKKRSALIQLLPRDLKIVEQTIQQKETQLENQIENRQQPYVKRAMPKASSYLPGFAQLDFNQLQEANQAIEEITVAIANAKAMTTFHEQVEAEIGTRSNAHRMPMKNGTIQAAQAKRVEDLDNLLNQRPLKKRPSVSQLAKLESPQRASSPENMPDLSRLTDEVLYSKLIAKQKLLSRAYLELKEEQAKETSQLSDINTLTAPKDRDLRSRPSTIRLEINVAECLRHLPSDSEYIEELSYDNANLQQQFREAFKLIKEVNHEIIETKHHNYTLQTRLNDLFRARRARENELQLALTNKPQPEPVQKTVKSHTTLSKKAVLKGQNSSMNPTAPIRQQLNTVRQQLKAVQEVVEHSDATRSVARKTLTLSLPKTRPPIDKKKSSQTYSFEVFHRAIGFLRNRRPTKKLETTSRKYDQSGFTDANAKLLPPQGKIEKLRNLGEKLTKLPKLGNRPASNSPLKYQIIVASRKLADPVLDAEVSKILRDSEIDNTEKQSQVSSPNSNSLETPERFSPQTSITANSESQQDDIEEFGFVPANQRLSNATENDL